MERIPVHDDELIIDQEAGPAAPLGEGRPPQGRAKAGLFTTAVILSLACLALAYQVSPWHRAATTLGDSPGRTRTRMFQSKNTNTEDLGTLSTKEIKKGDTVIEVKMSDVFREGDEIVIIDTDEGSSLNQECVVKSVGHDTVEITKPAKKDFPSFSFIVVPADHQDGSHYCWGCTECDADGNCLDEEPEPNSGLNSVATPAPATLAPPKPTPAALPPPRNYAGHRRQPYNGVDYDPSVDFDCDAGYSNWASGWSDQKKRNCCAREEKGCEFDCEAGYSYWMSGWSDGKRQFCCQTLGRGCDGEAPNLRASGSEDGPLAWLAAAGLLLGLILVGACLVFLFLFCSRPNTQAALADLKGHVASACGECSRSMRAPRIRQKPFDGEWWIYKPSDGRAVSTLAAPEFDAPITGATLEPGEVFEVSRAEPPTVVEQPVQVQGGYQLEVLNGGEGNCVFLKLADGRGWVLDREPGAEMCYKLYEPVDELWIYDPPNELPMGIRTTAFIDSDRTDEILEPGEKFEVCEMQAGEDSGSIIFLKLRNGRGWVFDQKEWGGELLCKRILQETWEYKPPNGQPIAVRFEPNVHSEKSDDRVYPDETFEVEEVMPGDDGALYLKLADGRGWLFDKHPDLGAMCFRVQ